MYALARIHSSTTIKGDLKKSGNIKISMLYFETTKKGRGQGAYFDEIYNSYSFHSAYHRSGTKRKKLFEISNWN